MKIARINRVYTKCLSDRLRDLSGHFVDRVVLAKEAAIHEITRTNTKPFLPRFRVTSWIALDSPVRNYQDSNSEYSEKNDKSMSQ